jgi:hypothetical protein
VTNLSQEASIWFDTCAVEQKVGDEWRRLQVSAYSARVTDQLRAGGKPWFGIASDAVNQAYPPGTCWNYVVGWPPDVPTNATWRLELRCGSRASAKAEKLDDALGIDIFPRRRGGQTILTPDVRQ